MILQFPTDPGRRKAARASARTELAVARAQVARRRRAEREAQDRRDFYARCLVDGYGMDAAVRGLMVELGQTAHWVFRSLTEAGYDPVDVTRAIIEVDLGGDVA